MVEGEELHQAQGEEEEAGHLHPSGDQVQVAEEQVLPLGVELEQEEMADQSNSLYSETDYSLYLAFLPQMVKDVQCFHFFLPLWERVGPRFVAD